MYKFLAGTILSLLITTICFGQSYRTYGDALAASQDDGKPMIVAFTASWCGPCRAYKGSTLSDKEVLAKLKADYHYYLTDVDEEPALAKKYRIGSLPTTKMINSNEKVLKTKVGVMSKREMLRWLDSHR